VRAGDAAVRPRRGPPPRQRVPAGSAKWGGAQEWLAAGRTGRRDHPCWDADEVRDDLRDYMVEHLGDPSGVLVIDETGSLE